MGKECMDLSCVNVCVCEREIRPVKMQNSPLSPLPETVDGGRCSQATFTQVPHTSTPRSGALGRTRRP